MTLGDGFVADHLPYEKITERIQVDWHDTRFILSKYRPDVLVNCLGKTGRPNVDWCESHKIETAEANVTIPIMLAELCAKLDIRMIQLGSGCIYFGASPNTSYGMYCGPTQLISITLLTRAGKKRTSLIRNLSILRRSIPAI